MSAAAQAFSEPRRPPPRPAGPAAFVPPVLPHDAAKRYQELVAALRPEDDAPVPDCVPVDERANIYPMLTVRRLREMADSIRLSGLNRPVVMHEEKIIDGRNREAACLLADVEPRFEAWGGKGGSVEAFIEIENEHRRHLPPSVLDAIAARRVSRYSRGQREVERDGPSHSRPGRAVQKAAADVPGAGEYGTKIFFNAGQKDPAIPELGRKGVIGVEDAKRLGGLPAPERTEAIARLREGAKPSEVLPAPKPRPRAPAPAPLALEPQKDRPSHPPVQKRLVPAAQTLAQLVSDQVVIWSKKHEKWWCPDSHGYTPHVLEAGVYTRAEAQRVAAGGGHLLIPLPLPRRPR